MLDLVDEYSPEVIAMLEAQRAYFASDECLSDRAASFRDLSPAECWAATVEACEEVEWMFALMDPATRERAELPEPIPTEICARLAAMQHR